MASVIARIKCALILLLLLQIFVVGVCHASGVIYHDLPDNEVLYGITYDGILIKIDPATGNAIQVREQLASPYRGLEGLEYLDGYFYATFNGNRSQNLPFRLVRFGFVPGDEIEIGTFSTGNTEVTGLGERPSARLYGTLSPGKSIREINLATLNVASAEAGLGALSFAGTLTAVTFQSSHKLYFLDQRVTVYPGFTSAITEMDLVNETWQVVASKVGNSDFPISNTMSGLAFDPNTPNTLYAVDGVADNSNVAPHESRFYKIVDLGSTNFSAERVNTGIGFVGVVGLSFGPEDPCLDSGLPDQLLLQNLTVSGMETFSAASLVAAGSGVNPLATAGDFVVASGGNAIFRSGSTVRLAPGFRLNTNAQFRVIIDPRCSS